MGELAERLDGLRATATSSDGRIVGLVRGSTFDVKFTEPDLHRHAGPESLGHQLERLLAKLAADRTSGQNEILREFGFETHAPGPEGEPRRRFERARAETRATGVSPDRAVAVATIGFTEFRVRLNPDVVPGLDETRFRRAFRSATAAMVREYESKLFELRTAA